MTKQTGDNGDYSRSATPHRGLSVRRNAYSAAADYNVS